MSQEGEAMVDGLRWVVYARAGRMKKGVERAGSRRKDLAAVNACRQGDPSHPACRWVTADYMRRWEWESWVGRRKG